MSYTKFGMKTQAHQAAQDSFEETRDLFVAFGDRSRQDIIVLLATNSRMTVKELSQAIGLSRPATSHHIKILKDAGLLGERKEGVRTYYCPVLNGAISKLKTFIALADEAFNGGAEKGC